MTRTRALAGSVGVLLWAVQSLALQPSVVPAEGAGGPGKTLLLEAQSLLADRRVSEIARRAEANLEPLLKDPDTIAKADAETLVRLATLQGFGSAFARVGRVEGPERETLRWLLARESLLTTLMLAMSNRDAPDTALGVVSRIRQDHGDIAAIYPDLTAALAVVYDSFADMSGEFAVAPDPARASRLFAYYTRARLQMRFDPKDLPWQLGVFVVDCRVTDDDLVWALKKYGGRSNLADIFFDVVYVGEPTYSPAAVAPGRRAPQAEPDGQPTLEQMLRSGGTTRERALFTVSICRALGVPSSVIAGATYTGDTRIWLGLLQNDNGRVHFDLEAGRYDEFRGFPGDTVDPQTYEVISEQEMGLLAELQQVPPKARLLSSALSRLASSESVVRQGEMLTGTGEEGNARQVALLVRAIQACPSNRVAWARLREMARNSQLVASDLNKIIPLLEKAVAPKYPAFALETLRELVSWRGNREQLDALRAAGSMFATSPQMQMRIQLYAGDLMAESGRDREALAAYGLLLDNIRDAGPVGIDAMERVDRILREKNALGTLVDTYATVWGKLAAPTSANNLQGTTFFQLGSRYADLLEETGDRNKASQIRLRLDSLVDDGQIRRGVRRVR